MPYDVVVKGGHVLDPGQGLDGRMDIGITNGRIAAIQPDIAASEAARVVEVRGSNRYVTPGLIDIHTHVAYDIEVDTSQTSFEACADYIKTVVTSTAHPTAMQHLYAQFAPIPQ